MNVLKSEDCREDGGFICHTMSSWLTYVAMDFSSSVPHSLTSCSIMIKVSHYHVVNY